MRMDRRIFFAGLRHAVFGGRLSEGQVAGIEAVLTRFSARGWADPRWLAYMLATAHHETAGTMQADRTELLRWIAFHEMTHAVQFTSVPWLREHLGGLLRELLAALEVSVDPRSLLRLPTTDDVRGIVERVRSGSIVGLVAGPRQRDILDRMQSTMALVEGHAEHVMDAAGEGALPSLAGLRATLEQRRASRPPLMRVLERLLGLEMKMRQYETGKRFCDAVVDRAGVDGLNRAWSDPALLPTSAELADPVRWLARAA